MLCLNKKHLACLPYMEIIHLCLFLATCVLSISIVSRFKARKPKPNLPPGPWKLPFIGNIHNLIGAVPHRGLHTLSLKYGPMMHLQLGELSAVIISSPEAAREVMKTHDVNFASRPSISVAEIIGYGCTTITFAPYGDYWRQLRKICTLELLSMKRVQSFRSIREQVFTDVVRKLSSQEGSSVNLTEILYNSAYMVTSLSALGNVTDEKEMFLAGIRQAAELASGFDVADLYPSIKLLQRFSIAGKKLRKCHEETDFVLEKIIQDHKANLGSTDESRKHEDLLDVLLRYQAEGNEVPLTTDNIKAVVVDIMSAGSETSATVVNWAMAEMMKNPAILKKAQHELRGAFDDKGYVDESGLDQLEYMKCIIKETLRMHPPAPLLLPRKGRETCVINGYVIPADTKVIVNAWSVNRDPTYWTNPDTFQPERFIDSSVDYKGNNFEYIPFGAGRRICPGINFGLANVQLPLAMFIYYFDWKLPVGMRAEDMDMAEGFGATAGRKMDLCIIPVIRRVLPARRGSLLLENGVIFSNKDVTSGLAQNEALFQSKVISTKSLSLSILAYFCESKKWLQQEKIAVVPNPASVLPSLQNATITNATLFVDGAVCRVTGIASCGGVLRDSSDAWLIEFSLRIGVCSVVAAKLWSLYYGVTLAYSIGKHIISFSSDSAIAICNTFGNNVSLPYQNLSTLTKRALNLCSPYALQYVPRSQNTAANYLAKAALGLPSRLLHVILEEPISVGDADLRFNVILSVDNLLSWELLQYGSLSNLFTPLPVANMWPAPVMLPPHSSSLSCVNGTPAQDQPSDARMTHSDVPDRRISTPAFFIFEPP